MHKSPFMIGPSSAERMRKIKKGEGTSGVNDSGWRRHFLLSFPVSGATSGDRDRLTRRLVAVVALVNGILSFLFAFTVVFARVWTWER